METVIKEIRHGNLSTKSMTFLSVAILLVLFSLKGTFYVVIVSSWLIMLGLQLAHKRWNRIPALGYVPIFITMAILTF